MVFTAPLWSQALQVPYGETGLDEGKYAGICCKTMLFLLGTRTIKDYTLKARKFELRAKDGN
ncbi:MAG: hypothetical protein DWC04_00755 [Candidatus Poseidoniales archaeon]|nr:MAG: hypothetical protein DWC04_00755 [Candidatus Poseidoniales archaeon]